MAVNKAGALGALNNVLQNYIYGLGLSHFSGEVAGHLERVVAKFPDHQGHILRVNANDLGAALRDPERRGEIAGEFEAALIRMVVREAYEVAVWYAEETKQSLKSASWYWFARITRNAVSHKQAGIMTRWPGELAKQAIFNVTWRGLRLDSSMVGNPIPLGHGGAAQLFHDIFVSVRDSLS